MNDLRPPARRRQRRPHDRPRPIRRRHHCHGSTRRDGRWPANVAHDGSPDIEAVFAQAGERRAGGTPARRGPDLRRNAYGKNWAGGDNPIDGVRNTTGTADRFYYCAKASKHDRGRDNNHPTVKPVALMRWLVRLAVPKGGTVLDPFTGSGTTGVAAILEGASFTGIEAHGPYVEIARRRLAEVGGLFTEQRP